MVGAARRSSGRAGWFGRRRCALVLVVWAAVAAAPARGGRRGPAASDRLQERVAALQPLQVQHGLRGLEVEGQRVDSARRLSTLSHPPALGRALTHPRVTTDFAESQTELITSPSRSNDEVQAELGGVHGFVAPRLPRGELLWAGSMPPPLQGRGSVPIAQYGSSHLGRLKTLYREGLAQRYGDLMQAISGVHFNYSFPEAFWPALARVRGVGAVDQRFISEQYFGLLRNYRRVGWLTTLLFGASPAVDRSFLDGAPPPSYLQYGSDDTLVGPFATSLRQSGDLGYAIKGRRGAVVSLNGVRRYLTDLAHALSTPNPDFGANAGPLTTAPLQQEAELYGDARPKRTPGPGERVLEALRRRGVEYVELRNLDRDPFVPTAVDPHALYFLEALAVASALRDSPPIKGAEERAIAFNHATVASVGRRPGLKLQRDGREVELRGWAQALLDELRSVCDLLDEGLVGRPYAAALAAQQAKLEDPARLPSARLARPLRDGQSFRAQTLALSGANHAALLAAAPDPAFQRALEAEVARSFAAEAALREQDAASGRSFPQFVVAFLRQTDTPPARSLLQAAAAGVRGGHRSTVPPPRVAARP